MHRRPGKSDPRDSGEGEGPDQKKKDYEDRAGKKEGNKTNEGDVRIRK